MLALMRQNGYISECDAEGKAASKLSRRLHQQDECIRTGRGLSIGDR